MSIYSLDPLTKKDQLIRNVIDYFTEKWNQKKSDDKEGEMKSFKYERDEELLKDENAAKEFNKIKKYLENKFKKTGKDPNEYLAFRNTKSQQIKTEKVIEESGRGEKRVIYYKRKLNNLLNIILMLNDDSLKVNLLKRHVYLNYEFMHAKCQLKDLDFLFDGIDTKMNLRKKNDLKQQSELIGIVEVYNKIYPIIYNHPNLLYIELLSRLVSRSKYVERFSSIILNKPFIKDEAVKVLFKTRSDIVNFYSEHDGPLLFIHTRNESNKHSTIHLVDSTNSRLVKFIDLNKEIEGDVQIMVKTGKETSENKNDAEYWFFYYSENSVYFQDSDSSKEIFKKKSGQFKTILVLDTKHLAIAMSHSIALFDLERNELEWILETEECPEENTTEDYTDDSSMTVENGDEIELIESTIPKETVFTSDFLDAVDGITIIVGLKKSKIIQIYRFNNKNKAGISLIPQSNPIIYDYFGFYQSNYDRLWRESLIIDSTFLIGKVKRDEALIRFCLQENDETKVIEIKNNGEFEVIFNMKQNDINEDDDIRQEIEDDEKNDQEIEDEDYEDYKRWKNESIQLDGFIDSNRLLLKQRRGDEKWWLFLIINLKGWFTH